MKKTAYLAGISLLLGLAPLAVRAQHSISGTIFDDVNYGGGAGRNYSAANTSATNSAFTSGAIRRPLSVVELYDGTTNAYVASTTTDANGLYTFSGLTGASYTVRVANSTVGPVRAGGSSSLIPVQTFRTVNGTTPSSRADDVNRVGGESPAQADAAPNGNVTLAFVGTSNSSTVTADATIFIDKVQVLSGGNPVSGNPIANPDFEIGTLTANGGSYQYGPSGTGWTYNAYAGIQSNGSAFTPPNTTSNSRAAFVQSTGGNNGSLSQTFALPAGTYTISFIAANRGSQGQNPSPPIQTINVTVNGTTVTAGLQAGVGTYATYTTNSFTISNSPAALNTITAQSVAPVTIGTTDVTGVDFGYNFDTVVNTNDSGQGSLRQFVLNANALANSTSASPNPINRLTQAGNRVDAYGNTTALPTSNSEESSIFMIPNGATTSVPPGLRAGMTSGLNANDGSATPTNRWARIALSSTATIITSQYTVLDGTTQTANVGDTNAGTLGLGGTTGQFPTVGVQKTTFNAFNRPEVEVYCNSSNVGILLLVQAPNTTVRGLALHGGGTAAVYYNNTLGFLLENNYVGITAYTLGDPTTSVAGSANTYSVLLTSATNGSIVRRNLIAYSSNSGIYIPSGGTSSTSSILITDNELVQNGYRSTGGDNITIGDGGATGPVTISNNLIRTANSDGVQFDIGNVARVLGSDGSTYTNGANTVQGNTFFDNGNGGASAAVSQLEGAAILYLQRTGSTTGTNQDVITQNVVFQTQSSGIVVGYGQSGVKITQNSTYFNGTPFNSATGGNLGIDLIPQSTYYVNSSSAVGRADYGNGDGVTPNTGSTTAAFGNAGINYPVFTAATAASASSSTVNVSGYVGNPSVAGGTSAFAGATVEIFAADNVPANNNGPVLSGDNQKQPHGEGRSYLATLTADNNGYFSGTITLPAGTPPLTGTAITGYLTATAYLTAYGTSEFGPNQPIVASADVQAVITGSSPVNAGGTGTFNVTFSNLTGNAQADGVVAVVQLPSGLSGVTVSGGGSYNATTGLVTYTGYTAGSPGSLASGNSFASTISYTQPLAQPVTATASISTTTTETGRTSNNTSSATNATTLLYNLTTAVSGPTATASGNQVEYVVTSTNVGGNTYPSPANVVTQTVSIPAGATNLYVTGGGVISGSSAAGYTVTWTTSLAAGQSESQTVNFTAPATSGNSYSLTANISGSPADQVLTDNSATATTTTSSPGSSQANAFVHIYPTAANVAPGATGSFIVRQGNSGPGAATGVQTTVVLPPNLSGVVVTDSTGNAVIGAAYNATTGVVTLPTIASQSSDKTSRKRYTIAFTAPANGGTVTATAAVATTSPDQIPTDNTATAQITVAGTTDVVVQLTGPRLATPGQLLTYTLTTSDAGPQSAQNVQQQANLPAGLPVTGSAALLINGNAPTSVTTTGGITTATYGTGAAAITYNVTTGAVTLPAVAVMGPGAAVNTTFAYVAATNGSTSTGVSASATNAVAETTLTNNAASLLTAINPSFDVQVLLNGPSQVAPGNPVTLDVATRNNGPSAVSNVSTTVNIPVNLVAGTNTVYINNAAPTGTVAGSACTVGGVAGNTYSYADGSTYNSCSGLVTLPNSGALAGGGSAAVTSSISFVLPTGYKGTLATTATATPLTTNGLADDALPANNTAVYQPLLQPASGNSGDLSVTLSGPTSAVAAGSPVTLTMQTTATIAETGLLQYVQLPPGLTSGGGTVTVTGNAGATYDNVSGLLTLPGVNNIAANSPITSSIVISQAPGTSPLTATASVSSNERDTAPTNNTAVASVTITPSAVLSTTISGPGTTPAGGTVSYLIASTNTGYSASTGTSQRVQVPTGATNVTMNGVAVTPDSNGYVTVPVPATLQPGTANTVNNVLSFTAPGAAGSSFTVPTTLSATGPGTTAPASATASQTTTIATPAPLALDVVNVLQAPQANTTATALPISPLQGVAQGTGSSLTSYTITSLPLATQGKLYVLDGSTLKELNTTNFPGLVLTPTQTQNLRFLPVSGYVGNATFTYQDTDNRGVLSNVAHYLIPIAPDLNSMAYATPSKGGTTAYQNNDVLAYVVDANGATYTTAGTLYDSNTGRYVTTTATNPVSNGLPGSGTNVVLATTGNGPSGNTANQLPGGVSLNPTTGQLYVSDRTKLPAITSATTYSVNVVTTDIYGGTNVVTESFTLGGYPLPVTLTRFEATAQGTDALLTWTTASEQHSDHFEVERSLDGLSFVKIGQVAAQGSSVTATSYRSLDAGIGRQVSGSVYYRLRQVDVDGTAAYSPVRPVTFAGQPAALSLYPTPARSTTTLDLSGLPAGPCQVTVLNTLGEVVLRFSQDGGTRQLVDVQALATGAYVLRITGTTGTHTLRLTRE